MGLDMYLKRKIYVGGNYDFNEVEGVIDLKTKGVKIPIDLKKVTYIEETAGYWRKANAIHNWFVDNVQGGTDNCGTYDVDISQLKELLCLCKKVKEKAILDGDVIKNVDEIKGLLPTQSGFFFGSTDYDKWYLSDIDTTIQIIEEQLKREEELKSKNIFTYLEYHSSW